MKRLFIPLILTIFLLVMSSGQASAQTVGASTCSKVGACENLQLAFGRIRPYRPPPPPRPKASSTPRKPTYKPVRTKAQKAIQRVQTATRARMLKRAQGIIARKKANMRQKTAARKANLSQKQRAKKREKRRSNLLGIMGITKRPTANNRKALSSQAQQRLANKTTAVPKKNNLKVERPKLKNIFNKAGKKDSIQNEKIKFWKNTVTFKGSKVFQRNDLINPNFIDGRGRTNLERMKKGLSPIGPDKKSINLHHLNQKHNGALAEMTETFHKKNSKVIHINPNSVPSGIDRKAFNKWRSNYWKSRAKDFK